MTDLVAERIRVTSRITSLSTSCFPLLSQQAARSPEGNGRVQQSEWLCLISECSGRTGATVGTSRDRWRGDVDFIGFIDHGVLGLGSVSFLVFWVG